MALEVGQVPDTQRGTKMVEASGYGFGGKASGKEAASGILLIVALLIGLVLILPWLLKKLITSTVSNAADTAKELLAIPTKAIEERQTQQNIVISDKIRAAQQAYAVQPYTNPDGSIATLNEWSEKQGLLTEFAVKATELVPYSEPLLSRAGTAGAEFRSELVASGDEARYEALDPISKGLVTLGEGLSRTFIGWSPYKAGQEAVR